MADNQLDPQEIEAFARGLWYLATIDGEAHETEQKLIHEFIADTGNQIQWEPKGDDPDFGPRDVANALSSTFLRRVFMKLAVALVHADGVYTDKERLAIGEFAELFGLSHTEFGALEQEAKRIQLPQ